MDNPKVLTREEALQLVRDYKRVIAPRFRREPKVLMYGSYAKGYANPWSDIDVAIIVPEEEIVNKWEQWADLCGDVDKVSLLIEPVLIEEPNGNYSPLYSDVMRTGVAV